MQEYTKDSRLLLLEDSETGDVAWLRRHRLDRRNTEYMQYMLDLKQRGASISMTRQEIDQLFLGEDYTYNEQFDWYSGKSKFETGAMGICYHPTEDLDDSCFKFHFEAPAMAHVLWKQIDDEIDIQSIAVDSDFHFRQLMYEVLLDELKLSITKSGGYEHMEKIVAIARSDLERTFYE